MKAIIKNKIGSSTQAHDIQRAIHKVYGPADASVQTERYIKLLQNFFQKYKNAEECFLFSTPGRVELGGNHTDHNHGRVLAASINLDSIAAAARNETNKITVYSEGYDQPFQINSNQTTMAEAERGTTSALIRGIVNRCRDLGYQSSGFNAYISSRVLPGSGLSSSASIEVLIATIVNFLFNQGQISPEEVAKIGQYAENEYFGKPCGLMDQLACAVGGIIAIDFKNPANPLIKRVHFDLQKENYRLLIVNTGGNHADLTADYAAVPHEMKAVAQLLNRRVCRDISKPDLYEGIDRIRNKLGDRAVLRVLHFLHENERVEMQVKQLHSNRFRDFLKAVNDSGDSSFKWLQNVFSTQDVKAQGIPLALALSENYISEIGEGACRVHGGGFAGTVLVFLPKASTAEYIKKMEAVFGSGSVEVLNIRKYGTVCLNRLFEDTHNVIE